MKKIMATMMLMLLVISMVPLAFAEEVEADAEASASISVNADTTDESETDSETDRKRPVARRALRKAVDAKGVRPVARAARDGTLGDRVQKRGLHRLDNVDCTKTDNPEACEARVAAAKEKLASLSEEDKEKFNTFAARRFKHAAEARGITTREEFQKFKEEHEGEFKARRLAADRAKKARERYQNAKEKFVEHRKAFRERKADFQETKKAAKEACEADAESDECTEAKAEVKGHAKESMLKAADAALAQLDKIKSRVEESESLSEEEAAEILAKVNGKIAEVESIKERIESLGEDAGREEYNAVAKELRSIMKDLGKAVKRHVGNLVHARMGGVIVKAKHLQAKLDHLLERMTEAGKDTDAVEPLVDDFNAAIENAHAAYNKAKNAFRLNNPDAGHEALKEVHASLKEAHGILREIVSTVKEQGAENELEAAIEADATVEAEA